LVGGDLTLELFLYKYSRMFETINVLLSKLL
jgi:hypothetical protein